MNPKSLRRDKDYIAQNLVSTKKGDVITKKPCQIQVPERYLDRHLATIGADTYVMGIFAIIMDDVYCVHVANAMVRITPGTTRTIDIDGTKYLSFEFLEGDQVIASTDLIQRGTNTYYIYDEFVAKGRVPWFIGYHDLGLIFESAGHYAGVNLGNRAVLELIISTICRNPDDLTQLYRHFAKSPDTMDKKPPITIPFRSVPYNTTDTTSRLIGAYFTDSVTAALVNPSDNVERIETLLRS